MEAMSEAWPQPVTNVADRRTRGELSHGKAADVRAVPACHLGERRLAPGRRERPGGAPTMPAAGREDDTSAASDATAGRLDTVTVGRPERRS
jgi:hypothetical protein